MYIKSREIERNIQIYKIEQIEEGIKETAQVLLDQLKDNLCLMQGQLEAEHITIEKLFESEDKSDIDNAEKLQYLIDNIYEVVKKLEKGQEFSIHTYDDPAFDIAISKTVNGKIEVSAYSNLYDGEFWDEVIKWIDDTKG